MIGAPKVSISLLYVLNQSLSLPSIHVYCIMQMFNACIFAFDFGNLFTPSPPRSEDKGVRVQWHSYHRTYPPCTVVVIMETLSRRHLPPSRNISTHITHSALTVLLRLVVRPVGFDYIIVFVFIGHSLCKCSEFTFRYNSL